MEITAQKFFDSLRKEFGHEIAKELLDELENDEEMYQLFLEKIKENKLHELNQFNTE